MGLLRWLGLGGSRVGEVECVQHLGGLGNRPLKTVVRRHPARGQGAVKTVELRIGGFNGAPIWLEPVEARELAAALDEFCAIAEEGG